MKYPSERMPWMGYGGTGETGAVAVNPGLAPDASANEVPGGPFCALLSLLLEAREHECPLLYFRRWPHKIHTPPRFFKKGFWVLGCKIRRSLIV